VLSICSKLESRSLKSAAASAVLLMAAAGGAMAQPPPGSLPGGFSASQATGYSGSGSSTATISTGAGNVVLQWGGTALAYTPSGDFTGSNPGFSIGSGATLAITNEKAANSSVLVNDLTGSPSQIYGTLDASGVGGPLYIANAKGIVVGSSGVITAPSAGIGLLAYSIPSSPFNGTVSISKSQATSGSPVTVQSGAKITGGLLLVAGTNTVNVALPNTQIFMSGSGEASDVTVIKTCNPTCTTTTSGVYALAGQAFNTGAGSVAPLPVVTVKSPPPPPPHKRW